MKTVALGGIWHETNTFAASRTRRADFEAYHLAVGGHLIARFAGLRTEVGGFLSGAEARGWNVLPTLFAAAVPSGLVDRDDYVALKADLIAALDPGADGVLLSLHGAMVVDGIDDADGDMAETVRRHVGPEVPVIATLDFHANVSRRLYDMTDALVGYDTYPHVDPFDRGVEAVAILEETLAGREYKGRSFRKLPLLTAPQAQETATQPMRAIFELAHQLEEEPGVRLVTVSPGFPYADVPHLGFSVAAYGEDAEAVESAAAAVADLAWDVRHDFVTANVSVSEAVTRASTAEDCPVVLVDVADNIGGGAPGDGTALLEEILRQRCSGAVVVVADAVTAAEAMALGVDATHEFHVGGKTDRMHGDPVTVRATVRSVGDGRFVHKGSYMTGQETWMGTTAVLDADGVEIVVTERPTMPFDAEQLRSQGIEPGTRRALVVKSAIAWRAAFGDVAKEVLVVDTPGVCTSDLSLLPYEKVQRPIHPIDSI